MKSVHCFFLFISTMVLMGAGLALNVLPLSGQKNSNFSASGKCELCHGTSTLALTDSKGNDVSPVSLWRSTMLANSSNDPFWRAKVKHEGLVNPEHKDALENVCTRCHAPMGMINAFLNQTSAYNLDSLKNDEMGQDGISCTLCHQVSGFDKAFSGNFQINSAKEIYGPYANPVAAQMNANTGFTPVYNEIINESRLCGSCHTLITNSVDEHGEFTGETFVEQALYHEWENSDYNANGISCQSCHMPRIEESIKISSRPGFLAARSPFGKHSLMGGNFFMLELLKSNHEELQLRSGEEFLEATLQGTRELLTKHTIEMQLTETDRANDSVYFQVRLSNKAGHKFPTGFPSRRAYLEFMVVDDSDTLFHSGKRTSEALDHKDDVGFEPHYQTIDKEQQVQIYEFVMGDDEGEVTTILERAFAPLKDNRILPVGFSQLHANYDTVKIVGLATSDIDYHSTLGEDQITYVLPKNLFTSEAKVIAQLRYETVPESWLHDLFEYSEDDNDIDRFKRMYENMENQTQIVARDSLQFIASAATTVKQLSVQVYPNPATDKLILSGANQKGSYSIFSSNGKFIKSGSIDSGQQEIQLELSQGSYFLIIESGGQFQSIPLIVKQ